MMLIMSMFESLTMLRWTSWPECPEVPVDLQEVGRDNEWRDPRICFCFFHYYCCCSYHALIVDVVDNDQNDVNDIDDDGTRWGATTSGETHASVFICYYCYHFFDVVADGDDKILII